MVYTDKFNLMGENDHKGHIQFYRCCYDCYIGKSEKAGCKFKSSRQSAGQS